MARNNGAASETEDNIYRTKRQRREWNARYRAQTDGGEESDFDDELKDVQSSNGKYFDDTRLREIGFREKKVYQYCGPDGVVLAEAVRYVHPVIGAKRFLQRRPNPNSHAIAEKRYLNGLGGLPPILYAWPHLQAKIAAAREAGLRPEVFITEGEKDADRLNEADLIATTVAGGNWAGLNAQPLAGCDLHILEDNDEHGRAAAQRASAALKPNAASARIVRLPGLCHKQDVSDWLDGGESVKRLLELSRAAKPLNFNAVPFNLGDVPPMRNWIYGYHYIGGFLGATVGPGGLGKSSLVLAEAVAIVTGRDLLGQRVKEPCRVLYWNGEDPLEETKRRLIAICIFHGIQPEEVMHRLFIVSGRDSKVQLASDDAAGRGFSVDHHAISELKETIRKNDIQVMIVDPFVRSHSVNENDNQKINSVAEAWAEIADDTGAAIELVHHVRKSSGHGEFSVEDGRGASALHAATRSMRVLNVMNDTEAKKAQVKPSERRSYFRVDNGKSNMRPAQHGDWFRIQSVDIHNGENRTAGDRVGVVLPFAWPKPAEVTPEIARRIQDAIQEGPYSRAHHQAKKWAGFAVAAVLNLEINSDDPQVKAASRSRASEILAGFVKKDWLSVEDRPNDKREKVPFYKVVKWASEEIDLDSPL